MNKKFAAFALSVFLFSGAALFAADTAPSGTPPSGTPPGLPPSGTAPGMSDAAPATLSAYYTLTGGQKSLSGLSYQSEKADASVVYVNGGGALSLENMKLNKSGDTTSDDSSNFYGLNNVLVVAAGSRATLKDSAITASGEGSNAVFATGEGSKITVSNTTIATTGNSSRGLDATYGGTVVGDRVTITTSGDHCAALATDRGEGTITVTDSNGKTAGEGSPGIYSTGTITATGSSFTATGSEAAVVEGKNSITLTDTDISGAVKHGVMLYQSFSGDAGVGTSFFTMNGGTLTAAAGPLFYVTNTDSVINLNKATLKGSSGVLLRASTDSWGTSGSNGGHATLKANGQKLEGSVEADGISSAAVELTGSSSLTGALNAARTAGTVSITLDASSRWTVTADSYVSVLADADASWSNIVSNGHTVYYDATVKANAGLGGKTVALTGGGKITPAK